ncbi:MAG TPA: TetR/AcrR family transcriptional regulator [Candidatus Limnocylindrales bacterium]
MEAEKLDRRVRRTRGLLRSALLAAILEKGYERVTVQDIIDRADVGRSTFYAHFRDKEDLLHYGLEELRTAFDAAAKDPGRSPTLKVFEHFYASREVWRAMVGRRGSETFIRYLHRLLTDLLRSHLQTRVGQEETRVPLEALVEFAASTLIGLGNRWWLEQDKPLSPREMDKLYHRLTEPGIRAGLRPKAAAPAAAASPASPTD